MKACPESSHHSAQRPELHPQWLWATMLPVPLWGGKGLPGEREGQGVGILLTGGPSAPGIPGRPGFPKGP